MPTPTSDVLLRHNALQKGHILQIKDIIFYIFENSQNFPFQKIRETGSGKAQKPIE